MSNVYGSICKLPRIQMLMRWRGVHRNGRRGDEVGERNEQTRRRDAILCQLCSISCISLFSAEHSSSLSLCLSLKSVTITPFTFISSSYNRSTPPCLWVSFFYLSSERSFDIFGWNTRVECIHESSGCIMRLIRTPRVERRREEEEREDIHCIILSHHITSFSPSLFTQLSLPHSSTPLSRIRVLTDGVCEQSFPEI